MQVELRIERTGLMGQGVGHDAEGNIYFVPGTVPGDVVTVEASSTSKKYRDAELVRLESPSDDRCEPVCSSFWQCGGCDWLHWKYSAQVRAKEEILRHVLERSTWKPEVFAPTARAESTLGYRNRIQLRGDGRRLGFYRKRSHDIVDIQSCPVAHPRLNEALAALRTEWMGIFGKRKVELALQSDGSVQCLENQPHAAGGFVQVHDQQNEVLKTKVAEQIAIHGSRTVLELYAGNGNLTFACLDKVEEVFAVDGSKEALGHARKRVAALGLRNVAFVEARIDSRLKRILPAGFRGQYDTLLLDPPRAGAQGCIEPLIHEGLKTVVYVSCSPVAFTKDIQCLKERFRFDQVQVIDMFPNTRHIEFLACFSRLSC